jgi:hypothetical protein
MRPDPRHVSAPLIGESVVIFVALDVLQRALRRDVPISVNDLSGGLY